MKGSEMKARWRQRRMVTSREKTENDQHRSMLLESQDRSSEAEETVEEE